MKIRKFRQLAFLMAGILSVSMVSTHLTTVSVYADDEETAVVETVVQEEPSPSEVVQAEASDENAPGEESGEAAVGIVEEGLETSSAEAQSMETAPGETPSTEQTSPETGTVDEAAASAVVVITFEAAEGGMIVPDGQPQTNRLVQSLTVPEDFVNVHAEASEGYEFAGWTGDNGFAWEGAELTTAVVPFATATYQANFRSITVEVQEELQEELPEGEAAEEELKKEAEESEDELKEESDEEADTEKKEKEKSDSEDEKDLLVTISYVSEDTEMGTVSVSSESYNTEEQDAELKGSEALPEEGYVFTSWTLNEEEISTEAVFVPEKPEKDIEYVAHFAPEEEEEEEEVKPEQHFSGYANGLFVRVDAPEGAFPENTKMTVTGVDSSAYLGRINDSVAGLVGSARLVDITFTKDDEELQPGVPVQVSLRMGYMDSDLSCKAIHVEEDGSVSIVDGAPDGNTFAFDAEHFSEYGVIVLTQFTVISDVAEFEMQNGQAQVSAVIRPEDAPSKDVTWEIYNINGDIQGVEKKTTAEGAAVTADGVVTAQGPGTIVVRGYLTEDDTYNDLVEINVTPIMVKSITVTISGYDPTKVSSYILAGTTKQATATIEPSNAADQNLTWSSSHEGVATVDQNGLITAVREGTATITAFNEASELMGSITIRVLDRNPATATANAYQTNMYLGSIEYQIPVSQTGATVSQLFDRTHVFRGTEYSFTGTVFYNTSITTSQTNWQTMQNWTRVTAVRRYDNVNQYQDSTGWHNIGSGCLYPEYASISGDPEASENISTGVTDWGYTTNNGHFYKTLQISFYNSLTGEIILDPTGAGAKDPYGHGVIRFDNNTNNTLGGISLDDSVSDYYNKTYYIYKDTDARSQANLQLSEATVRNYYNNRTPDAVVDGSGTASVTYNAGSNKHEHYLVLCVIAPKEIQISYTSPIEATNMPENPGKLPTLKNEGGVAVANTYTIAPEVPEAEGMIFVGWAYGSHLYRGGDEITVPHKDVEFVARWIEADKVVQYAVRPGCEGMGTVSRTSEIIKENMNGSFAANNDGYHFIRWVTDPSAPDTSIGYDNQLCVPTGLTEATTFYACFERDPVVYASVLNGLLDGGTTEETHKVAYMGGQLITATPDPGCSFESISIDGTQITLVDGKASTTGLNAYDIVVDEDGDVKVTLTSITKDITVRVVYSVTAKITLTAASDEKVYDGSPLTNATVTAEGLPSGFTVQATASGSATNVGDAGVNTVDDGYKILDSAGVDQTAKFTDVTKVDGKLTIKPASLTITAENKEFTYTGSAQNWPKYGVTGLVGSDAVTAVVTGSITLPSESPVDNVVESYTFTSGSAGNYTVTTVNGKLTMKKASQAITITAASQEWPYDGSAHENTEVKLTSGSLLTGDTLVAEATGSVTNVADTAEGNNPVKAGYKVMHGSTDVTESYAITAVDGTLTITPVELTITAQDKDFTYDGTAHSWPEYDVSGLIGTDAVTAVVTGSITLPSESPVDNVVESYTFTSGSAGNYTITTEDGELTMKKASQAITITAASDEWPYDGNAHENTLVELTGGSLFEGDQLVAEATGSVTNVSDTADGNNPVAAGYKVMHGTTDVTENYSITAVAGTLTITPVKLTITAQDKEFTYDGTAHSWPEYDVTGLIGTDAVTAVVTGSITFPSESPVANVVESYEFTSGDAGNYTVSTVNGELTMLNASAAITITAASDEWPYDGSAHENTLVELTEGSLFEGDELVAEATGSVTNVSDTADGNNPVATGYKVMHGTTDVTENYAITAVAGKLTITPVELTITAQDKEFTYTGMEQSWPEYDVDGLIGSDAVDAVVTGGITLPSESPVANVVESYEFTSGDAGNYTISTVNGELTMLNASAAITITAASDEWPYDGNAHENTEVKLTSGSLLTGDTLVAEATGSVTNVSDTAEGNNPVKAGYKIMHGTTDVTDNYAIKAVDGTLTITPVELIITAQDKEFTYTGMEQSWPEYDVDGLIGSDAVDAVVTGGITLPSESPVANVVESYEFTSGDAGNYTVSTVNGELTMLNASAAITITAASDEWPYDGSAHENTLVELTEGSLFEGDELVAEATGSVTNVSDTADGNNPVVTGYKVMHGTTDVTENYAITAVAGTLTITPVPLTIAAQDKDFTYDGTEHSWPEYDTTGLIGDDAVDVTVTGSITFPSESPVPNVVESFEFTSGFADNYTITTEDGELTMKKASQAITITAVSDAWPYDGSAHENTEVKLTSGSLLTGDKLVAEASGSVTNVLDTADGNNPVQETYKVMHGTTDVTENYAITAVAGTLTITPVPLTITAEDKTFAYDGFAHSWPEYDVSGLAGTDEVTAVVTGSITLPDESPVPNVVESYEFTSGSADNYIVTTKDGELIVTMGQNEITITAASDEWPYDGNTHQNTEVKLTEGSLLEGDELVAEAAGSVTNVSDTAEGNNPVADGYKIMHGTTDVTGNYAITAVAGKLTITPVELTITAQDKEFTYDGTAQSWPEYDVSGLIGKDEVDVTVTGSITLPSESPVPNVVESFEFTSGSADNYTITAEDGELTMKKASQAIEITAASDEWPYDGSAHENTLVELTGGSLLEGDQLVAEAAGSVTNVSDTADGNNPVLENYKVMHGETDVTDNYAITAVAGTLTITPVQLTITAQDKEFTYNGTAQSWPEYDVSGLVGEDDIEAVVTGSITLPSESPVANVVESFEFTSGSSDNYTITTEDGELTMKNASRAITITAASDEWPYDGGAHENTVVELTDGTLFEGDELVAEAGGSVTNVSDTVDGNNPVAEGYKVMHGETDVTDNYTVTAVAGTLTINKLPVVLRTGSSEKYFDGTDIYNHELSISINGGDFVKVSEKDGEAEGVCALVGADLLQYKFTEQFSNVASKPNNLDYSVRREAQRRMLFRTPVLKGAGAEPGDNYDIKVETGTLTIKERTTPPTPPTPDPTPTPTPTVTPPTNPGTVLGANRIDPEIPLAEGRVLGAARAQTGDESNLLLWILLMLASAAGMAVAYRKARREKESSR